ncbi:MAG TPA: MFS transporter [Chitinophagales bacterium]|nr:MFS transporter [Chitinophagales bacterium]
MKKIITLYKNAYGGLSQPAWMLAIIQLINRSGAMVLPFLSIYITSDLGLDVQQAGIILSCFGAGSMIGSYTGGILTDKIGVFKVQFISLAGGGAMIILLMFLKTFILLSGGLFFAAILTDMLRPANTSSVSLYSKPENFTRSFSLNRMALNLGFALGPAFGGFLAAYSYIFLFIVDGATCILAGVVFYLYFRNRKQNSQPITKDTHAITSNHKSPWQDSYFLGFALLCGFFAIAFLQIFSGLPLYYRSVFQLHESMIGLLIGFNGFIVFLFEMILVYSIEKKFRPTTLIVFGTFLLAVSFMLINIFPTIAMLFIAMAILSFAEMFAMPFMVSFAVHRGSDKTRGSYVGIYTLAWSIAFIISPYLSTLIISGWNYNILWWIVSAFALLTAFLFFIIDKRERNRISLMKFN